MEILVKRYDKWWLDEVYEGVADVTVIFQIDGQVKEVPLTCIVPINSLQQHFLRILVWNIFDHESRPLIIGLQYIFQAYGELSIACLIQSQSHFLSRNIISLR